jgi:hypothetical protein
VDAGFDKAFGLDRDRSSCNVLLKDLVTLAGGEPAYVDVTCNGTPRRYFTGFARRDVSSVGSDSGLVYRYQLIDQLGALDRSPDTAITWSNRGFTDAVTDLLTAAGLSSSQIGPLYDPGSTYNLGTFDDITIETDENLSSVMRELMEFGGTAIWVSNTGIVRVSDYTGIPVANSSITYAWNPSGSERPIYDVRQQFGNIDAIVSSFTATGPTRSDGTEPNGTFTASGITGKHDGSNYRFAQSSAVCQAIAEREVIRRARVKQILSLDAMYDPDLMPGRTTKVQVSQFLGINDVAFVESISANADLMTITYIFGQSRVPGEGFSVYPPPYADFTFTLEAELIDTGGSLEKRLIVQCDASASYVAQGTIGYSWSVSGATPDPASIPAVVDPIFALDTGDPAGVSVTLTVSDGIATPQPVTKALDSPDVQTITRVLSIAKASNGWRILRDINTGYEDFTRAGQSCDATAKFSANGPLLSGWDDGAVYSWDPEGGSATLLWTEPSGTGITSIYRNQETAEDITVTAGAKLYRSQDNGATFTLLSTAANTINDVEVANASNYIRICTGNTVLESFDQTNFTAAQTGEAGSVCQQQANAPFVGGSNAACYTGTTTSAGLVVFDQGFTVDWSGVTAPSGITTISAALAEEAFICGDASGNLYKLTWDGSQYVASDIGQTDATGTAADLIRDDRLNELVFGSDSTWQSFKVLNFDTILAIDLQPSVQIGIGPLANLSPRYRLLIPTVGASSGGVYEYLNGSWTLRNSGLPTATAYGYRLVANPFDADEWLLQFVQTSTGDLDISGGVIVSDGTTDSPVWRTTDGGLTWNEVTLSFAGPFPAGATRTLIGTLAFDDFTPGRWYVGIQQAGQNYTLLLVGVGNSSSSAAELSTSIATAVGFAGAANEVILAQNRLSSGAKVYYSDGATLSTPSGSGVLRDWNSAVSAGDREPGPSNRTLFRRRGSATIYGAADYQASQPVQIITSAGQSVTWATHGAYLGGLDGSPRTGLGLLSDPFGTPSVSTAAFTGQDVGAVRADRQSRTIVAALSGAKGRVFVWDGTTETTIDASSLPTADLAEFVEPIQ